MASTTRRADATSLLRRPGSPTYEAFDVVAAQNGWAPTRQILAAFASTGSLSDGDEELFDYVAHKLMDRK